MAPRLKLNKFLPNSLLLMSIAEFGAKAFQYIWKYTLRKVSGELLVYTNSSVPVTILLLTFKAALIV